MKNDVRTSVVDWRSVLATLFIQIRVRGVRAWENTQRKNKRNLKNMAEDSSFESTLDELENLFQLATEFVRDLRDLKNEEKLKFYGLFKQVRVRTMYNGVKLRTIE